MHVWAINLQADDAGAAHVAFVLDRRQHDRTRVYGAMERQGDMGSLQGPALLAYDDSVFTSRNFDGLCAFGRGSKHADPTKTGRFGLG